MAHRLDDPVRERVAAPPLARVQADLHPVQLGEHVVGEVERAVREDVALAAAQDPERRQQLVGGRDLLSLPADVVGIETGDDRHRARVVADREVLVAELARRPSHLLDRRLAVGGSRVHVQVAADVGRLEQVGHRLGGLELAQLGRPEGKPELRVDLLLGRRLRQLAERGDVLG